MSVTLKWNRGQRHLELVMRLRYFSNWEFPFFEMLYSRLKLKKVIELIIVVYELFYSNILWKDSLLVQLVLLIKLEH